MIASSTTRPIARIKPHKVSVLIEKPKAAMSAKVATSATGIASMGMIVARTPCRNTNTTINTSTNASRSVCSTSWMFSLHVLGCVVIDLILEARRKALGEVIHGLPDLADDVEPVGVGILVDRQRAGRLAVHPAGGIVILGVELDPGDVAEPDERAVVAAPHDDLLEFLDGRQPPLGEDRVFLERLARRYRLGADLAGGRLAVLGLDRRDHLLGRHQLAGQPVRVQPDSHRVLPPEHA